MKAWFASHWTPSDLPGLRHLVILYDLCQRGEHQRSAEFRMTADTYGVTPRGQQMLRWKAPEEVAAKPKTKKAPARRYGGLKAVG